MKFFPKTGFFALALLISISFNSASSKACAPALIYMGTVNYDQESQIDDLKPRIEEILAEMESSDLSELWHLSAELAEIINDNNDSSLMKDSALKIIHSMEKKDPKISLGCARAMLDSDNDEDAISILLEMIQTEKSSIHLEAFRLLAIATHTDDKILFRVEKELNRTIDEENDPFLRIQAARTLHEISSRFSQKAKRHLEATLESDDREIRITAALALGEIGETSGYRVLREVEKDPTEKGRLARLILQKRRLELHYLNSLTERAMGVERGAQMSPSFSGLDLVSEIIERIRGAHILGDRYQDREGTEKLLTAAAKGMLNYLDPHSTYFSQKENERWRIDMHRNYAGIGAFVDTVDGVFTITRPLYSGPAYHAGLRSGDQIWKVDGWETFNHANETNINRLKGEPDTEVTITVYRPGWKDERNFTITREKISIPCLDSGWFPGEIAYIEIKQFSKNCHIEMEQVLKKIKEKGAKALIVDVRNNTGGYLREAVLVSSFFLPPGKLIVYTDGRIQDRRDYYSYKSNVEWDGPLTV